MFPLDAYVTSTDAISIQNGDLKEKARTINPDTTLKIVSIDQLNQLGVTDDLKAEEYEDYLVLIPYDSLKIKDIRLIR